MMVYRIAKWDAVFERAESRKLKQLTWIAMPVGFSSSGYQSMLDEFGDEAAAIYGAWCALCGVAASCAVRGLLGTSRGNPLKISHIARMSGFQSAVFEKLIAWASRPEIGWLETLSEEEAREILKENGVSGESPDDLLAARGNPPTTRPNQTQPNQTRQDPTPPDQTSARGGGLVAGAGGGVFDFGFSVDELDEVVRQANKLIRCSKSIDRDLVWEVACFDVRFERMVGDVVSKVAAGELRSPAKYCRTIMRRICAERGIHQPSIVFPTPPPVKAAV